MDIKNNIDAILYEHRFWLQIMGDHSRFIFYSLAPTESEYILTAQNFIIQFDQLLEQAQKLLSFDETDELTHRANEAVKHLREFKIELLSMSLTSDIKTQLPPTFYNDMLNELDEYLQNLNSMINGSNPTLNPLHYHLLWLNDAIGHAASIKKGLDLIETDLVNSADLFEHQFHDLNYKSIIFYGYFRTGLRNFAALERLNELVKTIMSSFMEFLENIRDGRMDNKILGTLMPLTVDHMLREECYYMHKLSESAGNIRRPDCNPNSPRLNN